MLVDGFGRKIDYLRVSVTDRCNLRCLYCMPQSGCRHLPHAEILSLEEIFRIIAVLCGLGISKVRFTGGEPLLRKNAMHLFSETKKISGLVDMRLTTNGVLLEKYCGEIWDAGFDGVNVSLDSADNAIFSKVSGAAPHLLESIVAGIDRLAESKMEIKLNCVPVCGLNDDPMNLASLVCFAQSRGIALRFIELMPLGCGKSFKGIPSGELCMMLEKFLGKSEPDKYSIGLSSVRTFKRAGEPLAEQFAERFETETGKSLPDILRAGFISPMSRSFCASCNRMRLSSDGKLMLCLHSDRSVDLKKLLREGASDELIADAVKKALLQKPFSHDLRYADSGAGTGSNAQSGMNSIGG